MTDPTTRRRRKFFFPENLLRRLDFQPDGCVVFTGYTSRGYGRVKKDGRTVQAHRAMWEFMVGPIPDGLDLDHLCRNRTCVNVGHLEPVTPAENIRRGVNHHSTLTHCPKGHEYEGENLYVDPAGSRHCRACDRERWHRRYRAAHSLTVEAIA